MSKRRNRVVLTGFGGVIAVALVAILVARGAGLTEGGDPPPGAAFSVNGEWVLLSERDAAADLYEGVSGVSGTQACTVAQEALVWDLVIEQVAAAEGIQVTAPTAVAFLEAERASLGEYRAQAEAAQAATRSAFGHSPERAATEETAVAMRRFAHQQLREKWLQGAPGVSNASIVATIDAGLPPGYLALIAFEANNQTELSTIYDNVMTDVGSASDHVDLTARIVERHGGGLEAAVTTFEYRSVTELPDFAAAAVETRPGRIGELERPDGTGVIYYVVANDPVEEEAMAGLLRDEGDMAYISEKEQELLDTAEIVVAVPCE